ncbi:MAG: triose-phosphate isomerase [Desulfobacterales bacterium]|nr:triose-phosphate isomerase [Desulfobacterales bacterium]
MDVAERRPLIAGNWKMYKTVDEAVRTAEEIVRHVCHVKDVDIMIAPPFVSLVPVAHIVEGTCVELGAQNLSGAAEGAYTGEISAGMLKSAGCKYVIIGHSERRQYFGETDGTVNQKINAAIQNHLVPVMCVGETEKEREAKKTFSILDKQVRNGLEGLFEDDLKTLVVAYEPVWAIGTGKTASVDQAQEVHAFLRKLLESIFSAQFSESIRILYGGSVKPENIQKLVAMPDVDGALVGGASLSAETFSQIIRFR